MEKMMFNLCLFSVVFYYVITITITPPIDTHRKTEFSIFLVASALDFIDKIDRLNILYR